jgi:hypothetical protein
VVAGPAGGFGIDMSSEDSSKPPRSICVNNRGSLASSGRAGHPLIASLGRTSRTSPSVMPQVARVVAGICPTISKTASAAFADFATASVALSSSPTATKNHCSIERPSAPTYLGQQANHSSIGLLLHRSNMARGGALLLPACSTGRGHGDLSAS